MRPPFEITARSLELCIQIAQLFGQYEGVKRPIPEPLLRRQNRISTIQASLAIEGNRLTTEQVTAVLDGKRVIGPARDILEVQNAIAAYSDLHAYVPHSLQSLQKAHGTLMMGLTADAGKLRRTNVGIFKGTEVAHVAPKAARVPELLGALVNFLKAKDNIHPLIKSSVFHYEFEFIHPFLDGNGRMGRLWQTVILLRYHRLFEYMPVETVIRERQSDYYRVLGDSDAAGHSTAFIEFMLEAILEAAKNFFHDLRVEPQTHKSRLVLARAHFQNKAFTRGHYLLFHKTISSATASRDLAWGTQQNLLKKTGDKARAQYVFIGHEPA